MRAHLVLAVLASASLLTGCIQAGIEAIEESRDERRAREQESSEGPVEYGPPTPTPPVSAPVTSPPRSPSPSPSPAPTPTPAPTPSPPPPSTPAPTPPPPPPPPGPWPREGSYVRFATDTWTSSGDETTSTRTWSNWTYADGDWTGTCEGAGARVRYSEDDPPHWPLFNTRALPDVGDDVATWYLRACAIARGEATYDGIAFGRHSASTPWPRFFDTEWDERTGLVLGWDLHTTSGGSYGVLVETDAPLASAPGYTAPHG